MRARVIEYSFVTVVVLTLLVLAWRVREPMRDPPLLKLPKMKTAIPNATALTGAPSPPRLNQPATNTSMPTLTNAASDRANAP